MTKQNEPQNPGIGQVVCAVRGGKESRATVSRAIGLALEHKAKLTYLHIVNAEFLGGSPVSGRLSVVYKELDEMVRFLMMILVDRAQRRGVEDVDYILREGNIRRQLSLFVEESQADIMVMGRPIRSPGSNVFSEAQFDVFVQELNKTSDLEIEVVTPS
jgi:nucleotide-binding universal stress UspA family protein